MPTLAVMPDPFVKWSFTCETTTEERKNKKQARSFLKLYLQGYAAGLKMAGVGTFQYVFKDDFSPQRKGSKDFIYTASVERKSRKVPARGSTVNPPKLKQPKP
jgi:hypothetical protein